MLYKIEDDYYVLVDNRYFKIDFVINNNDVEVKIDRKKVIENDNINTTPIVFNDNFKKDIIKNKQKKLYSTNKNKSSNKIIGKK